MFRTRPRATKPFMKTHNSLTTWSRIWSQVLVSSLCLTAVVVPSKAGVLLDYYYDSITGNAVSNLTSAPAYPASPDNYDVLSGGLASSLNVADDYGRLIRGYIEAPETGQYMFWITSDDDSELWLSPSIDPAAKVKIASNIGALGVHNYFAKPAQQSALISLTQGQKYYFEVLHKEGTGADFVSVMWQLPDGTSEDPLASKHLWPFPVDTTNPLAYSATPLTEAPGIITTYLGSAVDSLQPDTTVPDGGTADLTVTVDGTQPAYIQWYSNGVAIPNANLLSYHISRGQVSMNGAVYSVTITNTQGSTSASTTLSVTADTTPLTLLDALNLGNPAGDIAVVFSKPVAPVSATSLGNYAINNGAAISSAVMAASPDTVLLRTTGVAVGTAYTITVNNVQDLASSPNVIAANSTIPLEQYLNTWFRFDESSGTTASDSSGNGRNGAMVSDVTPGYAGKVFKALKFAGITGGYVQCQNGYEDFSTNGMTVALWAYPTTEGAIANWNRFIDFGNGPATDNILFARTGGDQTYTFEVYAGGVSGGKVTTPPGTLFVNQWQHVVATVDTGGFVTVYRNGTPIATGTTAVPAVVTRTNSYVGLSNWAGDDHYAGKMDDLRIYNRVLSPAAVLALANGGGADDGNINGPTVSVVATTPITALKNTSPGVFTFTRVGSTNAPVTILYSLGGTATNGVNYTNLSGSVVIPAGTNTARVFVTPIDFSFHDLQETVVLTLTPNANYSLGNADSDTVTIQNNDVLPAAISATADNPVAAVTTTRIDVWFAAPVANPSATTLANYTLVNAPGVTITNATLGNRNLRVVLGASGPIPLNAQLSVSGVQDPGGNSVSNQVPVRLRLSNPVNVVAITYHGTTTSRSTAFGYVTDGVVNNTGNGGTGFDTYKVVGTQFAGLLYGMSQDLQAIKVDLGQQFGDGGSWATQPFVYLLTNAIDTGSLRPETNPNWVRVNAQLISGSVFDAAGDPNPSPNTPIVFDLSGLPASQRQCFGWAVGGALGDGANQFISISELRGYGLQGTNNSIVIVQQPTNVTVTAGQVATIFEKATNGIAPLSYQWLQNQNPLAGATDVNYNIRPASTADSGSQFNVVISTIPVSATVTSQVATLTVLPRTTPPVVRDATFDPSNSVVEVWFDEGVDPTTSQTPGNYQINDPGLTLNGVNGLDAQGTRVTLSVAGAPTSASPTVQVSNVQDLFGFTMSTQAVPLLSLAGSPIRVVANQYQQGRPAAFARSTDGVVTYDANVTTWTTFGGPAGLSDFVGVGYSQPQVFGVVKVDLGYQFGDGGDWAIRPRVFIQKTSFDSNQTDPENDPADWQEVPATMLSANIFDFAPDAPVGTVPPPNTPIAFDLSQLPLNQRVGYGWALGGVQGNGPNAQFVSIAELRSFGQSTSSLTNISGAPQIVLDVAPLSQTLPAGGPLAYTVVATGSQPLNYQWQVNGANLGDNGRLSGSHASVLNFAETLPSDSGGYRVIVSNGQGSVTSLVANVTLTRVAFNGGRGWVNNGNAVIATNTVTLTDGATGEDSSTFLSYPLYIGAFTATWTYQDVGGGGADGTVFVLQNDPRGTSALGGGGGGLGYSGITPSVGLEFNVYTPNTPGIAFRANGVTGTPYAPTTPLNVASGDPIGVTVHYDGTTASLTLTDAVTHTSFRTNFVVDIPGTVGTNVAFVGFTGASGGVASYQQVSNFSFYNPPPLATHLTGGNALLLSWPASSVGFELQQTSALGAGWVPVANTVDLVGGQNQVTISPLTGTRFYRLVLP